MQFYNLEYIASCILNKSQQTINNDNTRGNMFIVTLRQWRVNNKKKVGKNYTNIFLFNHTINHLLCYCCFIVVYFVLWKQVLRVECTNENALRKRRSRVASASMRFSKGLRREGRKRLVNFEFYVKGSLFKIRYWG